MTTLSYAGGPTSRSAAVTSHERPSANSIWKEATTWLALLPVLFIAVNGRIETDSTPVAFRFTAMDEDSPGRKLTRLGCALLIVCLCSTRAREILATCKRTKLVLLLPAIAIVSVLWSQSPSHTLVDGVNLMLTTLLAIYLYVRLPGEWLVSFLAFSAFTTLLLSAIAVVAFPAVGIDANQQDAWRGIFGQRNNCAAVCVLFLVLALYWRPRGLADTIVRSSVLFLSLVFIVMSGSRTGWILTAAAFLLTLGMRLTVRIRSLERVLLFMAAGAVVTMLGYYAINNFNGIMATLDKDPTMTQRTIIWAQVIPSIFKHPLLGYGYSAFWTGLSGESMQTVLTTGWMEGQAQDGYLDILLQLGILGLIPLAVAFLRAFAQAASAVRRGTLGPVLQISVVVLLMVLLENIGESSLLLPLGIPWFYALIALLTLGLSDTRTEAV